MKAEPVAQLELIGELVGRKAVVADHLRVRRELGVDREQRVEYHVGVVPRDIRGRPHRVEDAQIRLGDKAQSLRAGALSLCREPGGEERRRPGGDPEFTTRRPISHPYLRCWETTGKA